MDHIELKKLLHYSNHGWPIFPVQWLEGNRCSCGSSDCNSPGKHPLVARGLKAATTDHTQVQAWREQWPLANWGMRTGDIKTGGAGILVVDIDAKSGGFETWELLRDENPGPIETVTVQTGRGGQHLWFIYPPDMEIRSSAGVLGRGIDIRAKDGYVLVPPSRTHQDYRFLLNPTDTALDNTPGWIYKVEQSSSHSPAACRASDWFGCSPRSTSSISFNHGRCNAPDWYVQPRNDGCPVSNT